MKQFSILLTALIFALFPLTATSQVDEDQTGAWYMYFWSTTFGDSQFGMQGDIQYRNWNIMGDLEQLLLRGGFTFQPKDSPIKFTLGYANITTGAFGDSQETTAESRIYQEALLSQKIGRRFNLRHRFRYEQRFVEGQDLRTRWRYAIFLDVPLNQEDTGKGAVYLALYNELFVNGEKDIGNGRSVQVFDRNRLYGGLGYSLSDRLKTQLGYMRQKTDGIGKNQLQISLHHSI